MNKRLWVAVIGSTLATIAPPLSLGYLLFRVLDVSLLRALPLIIALAIVNAYLSQRLVLRLRPWVYGYEARIDLKTIPGHVIPEGTRLQGKDSGDVWTTVKDQTADKDGKVCLMLKRVLV